LGFLLRDGKLDVSHWPNTGYQSKLRDNKKSSRPVFEYTQESYAEHITGLLRAYQSSFLQPQLRYPARVLEEVLDLPEGLIDRAVRLAIACHDIGKLGTGWQQWCEEWQQKLENEYGSRYAIQPDKRPFAHTDFDGSPKQRELQRTVRPSRPHHACESAELAAFFIESVLIRNIAEPHPGEQALARATVAAIARHHAATSQKFDPTVLCADAHDAIRQGLEVVRQGQEWTYDLANLDVEREHNGDVTEDQMTMPTMQNMSETLLYFLLVRVLRLADQRSFDFQR
jgi:CRISPR-associated endonuclease/helicase Cas3